MTRFQHLADELACDELLCALTDEQIQAIVEVLALTIHADEHVSPIEVAGFNSLVLDMPWVEGRRDRVREYVVAAVQKVKDVLGDDEARNSIVTVAAEALQGGELRERVYLMAATLAGVDLEIDADEAKSLGWLAAAFGIDEGTAEAVAKKVAGR